MAVIKIVPMPGASVPGPQGERGPAGADANTGDFEFNGKNMTTHGDMTIGVDVVPGVINISAYAGVNIQTSSQFGLYVNGIEDGHKVVTFDDLGESVAGSLKYSSAAVPATHHGAPGDLKNDIRYDDTHFYVCVADYTDGVASIWKRINWASGNW